MSALYFTVTLHPREWVNLHLHFHLWVANINVYYFPSRFTIFARQNKRTIFSHQYRWGVLFTNCTRDIACANFIWFLIIAPPNFELAFDTVNKPFHTHIHIHISQIVYILFTFTSDIKLLYINNKRTRHNQKLHSNIMLNYTPPMRF